MRIKDVVVISIAATLITATFFGVGFIVGDGRTLTGTEKLNFQLASLAGTWFGSLGTIIAVAAALYIASNQAVRAEELIIHQHKLEKNDNAIGAMFHALAVVADLRGRVTFLKNKTCKIGTYPLAVYTITMEGISTRYESLFDRELYRFLPGPTIDIIRGMSGSINGINVIISLISTRHGDNLGAAVTISRPTPSDEFEKLFEELDALYTSIETLAHNEQILKRHLHKY